jgi:hypothetical protein
MTFNSAKLTAYLLNKFGLSKELVFEANEHKINLYITQGINTLKDAMFVRNFTAKEIATMILNGDDPKTMDYYFMKLLKVQVEDAAISPSGALRGAVKSCAFRTTEAFGVLMRNTGRAHTLERGQIYFVMDIHENQIFPTSRSFRICSRKLCPISVINPNAGKKKIVTYGSGYTANYLEPPESMLPKHLILYCRNAWERKGEVKPSRAKGKGKGKGEEVATPDAIAGAVSVI